VRRPPSVTGYLCRDLLTCATCGQAMTPALWREQKVYTCTGCHDGRGARVDAELIDSEVWTRLQTERPDLTRDMTGDARHAAVERAVRQITVTSPYPLALDYRGDDERY